MGQDPNESLVFYEESSSSIKADRFSSLKPPPRHVPFDLKVSLLCNFFVLFGSFFFAFGMIFFWVFIDPYAIYKDIILHNDHKNTEGTITDIRDTNVSINKERVLGYKYTFSHDNEDYSGESFMTRKRLNEGNNVKIIFHPDNPHISKISGTNLNIGGYASLFVLIFPLVGLTLAFFGYKSGSKQLSMLKSGIITHALVSDVKKTNVTVNNRRVFKVKMEYQDSRGGTHTNYHSTTEPSVLTDEPTELILYNPQKPSDFWPIDDMEQKLDIDERGDLIPPKDTKALLYLFLVLICFIPHLFILAYKVVKMF